MRSYDLLSIHGMNTIVAVLNAEQGGAEFVARRLKTIIETRIATEEQQQTHIQVRYRAISFGQVSGIEAI